MTVYHTLTPKSAEGSSIKYIRKIFRKTSISTSLICTRTCACQGVTNVSFSENFAYVLNGWPLIGILLGQCQQRFEIHKTTPQVLFSQVKFAVNSITYCFSKIVFLFRVNETLSWMMSSKKNFPVRNSAYMKLQYSTP